MPKKYPVPESSLLIADLRRRLEAKNAEVIDAQTRRDAAINHANFAVTKAEYVINRLLSRMREINTGLLKLPESGTLSPEVIKSLKEQAAGILKTALPVLTGDVNDGFLSLKEATQLVAQLQGVPAEEAEKAVRAFIGVLREE